ncbi:MAG: tetratricopeptide repeat protein, partial [Bacteroidales bacterium]|nr:tetratricopeptide repeat protein [Bacteroidales bacterium]
HQRWEAVADQDTAMAIMKRMENTTDSTYLAYADSAQLHRIIEFDAEFNSQSQMEGRIEYQEIYIDPEPFFVVTCFATNEAYIQSRRSESWDQEFDLLNRSNRYQLNFGLIKSNATVSVDQLVEYLENKEISEKDTYLQFILQGIVSYWAGDVSSAIDAFNKAIDENSDDGYTWLNRGVFKAITERVRENEQQIGIENANIQKVKVDYSDALNDMSQAILLRPKWAAAWYNRGNIKSYAGDYLGAISDYSKAIELQPLMAEAYYNRGLLLVFLKRTTEACPDLSRAGELGITPAYNVIKRYCK